MEKKSHIVSKFFFFIIIVTVYWGDLNATNNSLFYSKEDSFGDPDWIGNHSDFDSSNGAVRTLDFS